MLVTTNTASVTSRANLQYPLLMIGNSLFHFNFHSQRGWVGTSLVLIALHESFPSPFSDSTNSSTLSVTFVLILLLISRTNNLTFQGKHLFSKQIVKLSSLLNNITFLSLPDGSCTAPSSDEMFIESFVAFTKTFLGKKQCQKGMYNSVSVIGFFSLLFQIFNIISEHHR